MNKHISYFNLLDAFQEEGCGICTLIYRFSQEKFGSGGNAWIRTIEKMIGKEGIC